MKTKHYMVCDPGYFLPEEEWQEACRQKDHYKALCELVERHGGKMLGIGDDGTYWAYLKDEIELPTGADPCLGAFTVDSGTWAIIPFPGDDFMSEWKRTHPFGLVVPLISENTPQKIAENLSIIYEEEDDDDDEW